ncbi:MAG: hypothetical protein NTV30_01520 [Chloroflexi bacterium]|nr:hypothetical protein [Chloroflexota bacterium]
MTMQVLITGGSALIGRSLVARLVQKQQGHYSQPGISSILH